MNSAISNFGLQSSDIEDLISILSSNSRVERIILFGSRAKGNYSEGSDIDIAISGSGLTSNDIINASLGIDELYLPYKVDIVILERIKESGLLEHIERVGEVLFDRGKI